jgi:hypothetical protein
VKSYQIDVLICFPVVQAFISLQEENKSDYDELKKFKICKFQFQIASTIKMKPKYFPERTRAILIFSKKRS